MEKVTVQKDRSSSIIEAQNTYHKFKVWAMVLISSLGMFQLGYILTILNTLMQYFQRDVYHFTDKEKEFYSSILNSMVTVGAGIGALLAGPIVKRLGRRTSMIIIDIILIIASVLTLIVNISVFSVGRVIGGFCIGFNSTLVPLYLYEIIPLQIRGLAGAFNQIQCTFGAFLAVIFGLALPKYEFHRFLGQWWRIMLGFPILIALIRLSMIIFVFRYETPKHLVELDKTEKARAALEHIYRSEFVEVQLQNLEQTNKEEQKTGKVTFCQLFGRKYRRALFIGCFIAFLQQMTGVNAFIFYSTDIFEHGKPPGDSLPITLSTLLCALNLIATLISGQIIHRFGRKKILIWGDLLITATIIATAILFLFNAYSALVYPIFIFIILFGLTYGPIPWVFISEILPDIGIGLAVLMNWLGAFLVAFFFPILSNKNVLGPGPSFFILAGFDVLALIILFLFVKETRGLTPNQISELYNLKSKDEKSDPEEDLKKIEAPELRESDVAIIQP